MKTAIPQGKKDGIACKTCSSGKHSCIMEKRKYPNKSKETRETVLLCLAAQTYRRVGKYARGSGSGGGHSESSCDPQEEQLPLIRRINGS